MMMMILMKEFIILFCSISFGLKRFPKTCITVMAVVRVACVVIDFAFIHKELLSISS